MSSSSSCSSCTEIISEYSGLVPPSSEGESGKKDLLDPNDLAGAEY